MTLGYNSQAKRKKIVIKIKKHEKIENKICLVTGGGSGMGVDTAIGFAKEGGKVIIADINKNAAQETVKKIKELGGDAIAVKVNITEKVPCRI